MEKKKLTIVNEEINYVVRNIEAVKALLECYETAKNKVPRWLQQCIYEEIKSKLDFENMSFQKFYQEDEEILLYPQDKFYLERDNDFCLGFGWGIENFEWEEIDITDFNEGIWCYLYYNLPDNYKKKKKIKGNIKSWEDRLIKYVKDFKCPNVNLQKFPDDEDEQYLIAYQLGHILNIKELSQNPEEVIKKTADLFIQFVKDTLPIVENNPLPNI